MRYALGIAGTLSFLGGAAMIGCAVMDEASIRTVWDKLFLNMQGTHGYLLLVVSAVCWGAIGIIDEITRVHPEVKL